jgi:hypothetical protein
MESVERRFVSTSTGVCRFFEILTGRFSLLKSIWKRKVVTNGMNFKSFMIVIYDCNESMIIIYNFIENMIVIYDCNESMIIIYNFNKKYYCNLRLQWKYDHNLQDCNESMIIIYNFNENMIVIYDCNESMFVIYDCNLRL